MYDRISFFGMPIKTLGSLGKIRVGRVTGNTHIFFFGLSILGDIVRYAGILVNQSAKLGINKYGGQ